MKTFNRTWLQDSISYNGKEYTPNPFITTGYVLNNTHLSTIQAQLKLQGRSAILVKVLSTNLKGKTDLHGRPYQPTKHIYTTKGYNENDQILARTEPLIHTVYNNVMGK